MSDEQPTDRFQLPEEPPKKFPWVLVIFGAILFVVVAIWAIHSRSENSAQQAAIAALDKELDAEYPAVQAQKDKVVQLTQQLDTMKQKITTGELKGKAAVDEYNKLAAEQRAERDKGIAMANEYNNKVSQLRKMEK